MITKTCSTIETLIKALAEQYSFSSISDYDTTVIRDFLLSQRELKGWSPKTFKTYRQYLSTFFDWAIRYGYIKTNPVTPILSPRLPKRLPRFLSREDINKLLAALNLERSRNPYEVARNRAILMTFILSGLRLSELINLKINDVDLLARTIFVEQGKGKKDRIVPIHFQLVPTLIAYKKVLLQFSPESRYFFLGVQSRQRVDTHTIYRLFQRLSSRCGIKIRPHLLRHSFGRISIESNLSIYKLRDILGHASVSTTMLYASSSQESTAKSFNENSLL